MGAPPPRGVFYMTWGIRVYYTYYIVYSVYLYGIRVICPVWLYIGVVACLVCVLHGVYVYNVCTYHPRDGLARAALARATRAASAGAFIARASAASVGPRTRARVRDAWTSDW